MPPIGAESDQPTGHACKEGAHGGHIPRRGITACLLQIALVLEYMNGGSLGDILKQVGSQGHCMCELPMRPLAASQRLCWACMLTVLGALPKRMAILHSVPSSNRGKSLSMQEGHTLEGTPPTHVRHAFRTLYCSRAA